MAGILATLGDNPFNTPVGQKILQATDASLPSENWALNVEICDLINDTDEGPKDSVKAIKKRLQPSIGKNYTVVLYTLSVLERCVKNCSQRFRVLVSQKDFILELVKLIGPKHDPPTAVQEKVLSLIQSWADAFQNNPDMQGVVQVYHDLKQKGIEFPMTDLDTMAPIHTPQRSVPASAAPSGVLQSSDQITHSAHAFQPPRSNPMPDVLPPQALPLTLNQEQLAKLRSELDIVQGNMKVFGDMLTELTPGKEHPQDLELLQELQKTCYIMQSRIVDLIDRIGVEEISSLLLRINDDLNNLFLRYERYDTKHRDLTSNDERKFPPPPSAEVVDVEARATEATTANPVPNYYKFFMNHKHRTEESFPHSSNFISLKNSECQCPVHGFSNLVEDCSSGDVICSKCGLVLLESVGQYSQEVVKETGAPANYLSYIEKVRNSNRNLTVDGTLVKAYKKIVNVANELNLPKGVCDRSNILFEKVFLDGCVNNFPLDVRVASIVLIVCRDEGFLYNLGEVRKFIHCSKLRMKACIKFIRQAIEDNIDLLLSVPFLENVCRRTNLPDFVAFGARHIIKKVLLLNKAAGHRPLSIVASGIFLSALGSRYSRNVQEISQAVGVLEMEIRQLYTIWYPIATELFPESSRFFWPMPLPPP